MREGLATFLMMLFILPAFIPWMPHGISHAMHDYHASHHQDARDGVASHNGHTHQIHAHGENAQELHHTVQFDIVSYYSDFLHVDLRHSEEAVLQATDRDFEDVSYDLGSLMLSPIANQFHSEIRGPPDRFGTAHDHDNKRQTYLLTQRLRV